MRVRGRRVLIWLSVVAASAGLLFVLTPEPKRVDRWESIRNRVTELKTEAQSRDVLRSVLRGTPEPGNSWDEYDVALQDALTWHDDPNGAILARFMAPSTADRAAVEKLIAAHGGQLDRLRLGAQRSRGQYPYQWEQGNNAEIPSLLASRKLSNLAIAQAKIWAEEGRPQDAADLLLDTSVFARDLGSNGVLLTSLIGLAVYSMVFDELHNLILSGKLTRGQLTDLQRKLERVDRDFPQMAPVLANELLSYGMSIMDLSGPKATVEEWWDLMKEGGWRYGLSSRQVAADAFDKMDSFVTRAQKLDPLDYAAATVETNAIAAEAASGGNPMVVMADLTKVLVRQREVLAHLRLLRAGTGFLATGRVDTLADPFGKNLSSAQAGNTLKIWSLGPDGKSNNGAGFWNKPAGQTDIVIEIGK